MMNAGVRCCRDSRDLLEGDRPWTVGGSGKSEFPRQTRSREGKYLNLPSERLAWSKEVVLRGQSRTAAPFTQLLPGLVCLGC